MFFVQRYCCFGLHVYNSFSQTSISAQLSKRSFEVFDLRQAEAGALHKSGSISFLSSLMLILWLHSYTEPHNCDVCRCTDAPAPVTIATVAGAAAVVASETVARLNSNHD